MTRYLCTYIMMLHCLLLGGCANYLHLRQQDLLDSITLCAASGNCYGVQARAGAIPIGVIISQEAECYGLRGGEIHTGHVYMGGDTFDPDRLDGNADMCLFWMAGGRYDNKEVELQKRYEYLPGYLRGKYYSYANIGLLPITHPKRIQTERRPKDENGHPPYPFHHFTQLEILLGFARANLRVGINIGEILDFAAGFIGVDLLADDKDMTGSIGEHGKDGNISS